MEWRDNYHTWAYYIGKKSGVRRNAARCTIIRGNAMKVGKIMG